MKGEVENACRDYIKKKAAYNLACASVAAARRKQEEAEKEMNDAGLEIRKAICRSMTQEQKTTLWFPFGEVLIEVKNGYVSHDGIYVHKLET
jgi:hypothetical protein